MLVKEEYKAEYLASWIASAKEVDVYKKSDREVFVATNYNEQLILTCYRGYCPHINIVWIKDGNAEVLYQDIMDESYGQIKHSVGNLYGDWGMSENKETVYTAFCNRTKVEEK